ncbi:MAG: Scr1 family TA system antitoxin-like transcriptional regulator [Streptosporangiaceae bacterium]
MNGLPELGAAVRRLRAVSGLSGAELARRAGVPQPSVSRLEAGRRLADVTVALRLVSALDLGADEARELAALARDAYAAQPELRVDSGVSMTRGQLRQRVRTCGLVRSFSSAMVPMLLRTADYQTAGATGRRGAVIDLTGLLEDTARSFVFVVTEGALRTWPGNAPMNDQLVRVQELAQRPNVRLGVLPWRVRLPRAPLCDFTILGNEAVWIETFTTELTVTRRADVEQYVAAFEALEGAAVFGGEARSLVSAVAADFDRLS